MANCEKQTGRISFICTLFLILLASIVSATPYFGAVSPGLQFPPDNRIGEKCDDVGPCIYDIARIMELSNISIVGLHFCGWQNAEPEDPGDGPRKFDWTVLDRANGPFIELARKKGALPIAYIQFDVPRWAKSFEGTPRYWKLAEGFMEAVIKHFNEMGVYYFIFENEPDLLGFTCESWPDRYMDRLKRVYRIAKKVDPRNKIIAGNLSGLTFEELYKRGLKDYSDVIGFHPYSNEEGEGIDIDRAQALHRIMAKYGDGDKPIYFGEGWSGFSSGKYPGRESHLIPPSAEEVYSLRSLMIDGYQLLTTKTDKWDPSWLLGATFFTLNDWYGAMYWHERAVPHYDEKGRLLYYTVDGYNIGLDLSPGYAECGLCDYYGNPKDDIMHVFPGNGLSLANPGFELVFADGSPMGWKASDDVIISDFAHFGARSIILPASEDKKGIISQRTVRGSIKGGKSYSLSFWVRSDEKTPWILPNEKPNPLLSVKLVWYNSSDKPVKETQFDTIHAPLQWEHHLLRGIAPRPATSVEVVFEATGKGGVYLDDVVISGSSAFVRPTVLEGIVRDSNVRPIPGATVSLEGMVLRTDSQGRFRIEGILPGAHRIKAQKPGYRSFTLRDLVILPGKSHYCVLGIAPLGVEDIKAEVPPEGGRVILHWEAPPIPDLAYYKIYRSQKEGKLGLPIAKNLTTTTYIDQNVTNGITYYYTIRTVTRDGAESDNINQVSAKPVNIYLPFNVRVIETGKDGELLISWKNPSFSDFSHIRIYRSTSEGELGALIADNVEGEKYLDKGLQNGITYYYTVHSVSSTGRESTNTDQHSGVPSYMDFKIATPSIEKGDNSLTLTLPILNTGAESITPAFISLTLQDESGDTLWQGDLTPYSSPIPPGKQEQYKYTLTSPKVTQASKLLIDAGFFATDKNIIPNGDFEQGEEYADYWLLWHDTTRVPHVALDYKDFISGKRSVRIDIENAKGRISLNSRKGDAIVGESYTAGWWWKTGGNFGVDKAFNINNDWNFLHHFTTWMHMIKSFKAPSSQLQVSLFLSANSDTYGKESVWFDNIFIVRSVYYKETTKEVPLQ